MMFESPSSLRRRIVHCPLLRHFVFFPFSVAILVTATTSTIYKVARRLANVIQAVPDYSWRNRCTRGTKIFWFPYFPRGVPLSACRRYYRQLLRKWLPTAQRWRPTFEISASKARPFPLLLFHLAPVRTIL